jgi:hypothetical protein
LDELGKFRKKKLLDIVAATHMNFDGGDKTMGIRKAPRVTEYTIPEEDSYAREEMRRKKLLSNKQRQN